jgi:hypothetical protein
MLLGSSIEWSGAIGTRQQATMSAPMPGLESERRLSKVSRKNERVLGAKILHLYPDLV